MKTAALLMQKKDGGIKSPDFRFYLYYSSKNSKFVLMHLLPARSQVIQESGSLEGLLNWMRQHQKKYQFPLASDGDPFARW